MSAPALVPGPLYGLRTWSVVGERGSERLAAPQQRTPWPVGGDSLAATCEQNGGHAAPAPGCGCGIHAWHPDRAAARRVLGRRGGIPGVIEATGMIELHRDGFRAERARPFALFLRPNGNSRLMRRLGAAYEAEVVEIRGPDDIVAWCRERGLGLEPQVVDELLGPERLAEEVGARRRKARTDRLRIAAVLAAIALLVGAGLAVTSNPGDRPLHGRTGEIHQPR
jgi:hypothetical protein